MSSDLPPPSSPVPPPPTGPSGPGPTPRPRTGSGPSRPPGLRSQFGTTRDAAWNLVMAHIDLAKAEAAAIGAQIAGAIGLVVLALALAFFAVVLLVVGLSLFLAQWLLGSMGWGVLHGVLLFVGLAMASIFAVLGMSARTIALATLGGIVVAVIASLILGFELPNQLYAAIGDQMASALAIEAGIRPLVVGVALGAIVGLVIGIALAVRGASWAVPVLVVLIGAALGALSATTYGLQVGVGIGIAVGYVAWIAFLASAMARQGVDPEEIKQRFYPSQTIDTSKETLEWLKTRLPRANGS